MHQSSPRPNSNINRPDWGIPRFREQQRPGRYLRHPTSIPAPINVRRVNCNGVDVQVHEPNPDASTLPPQSGGSPAIVSDRLLMNQPTITTHSPQTNVTVMIHPSSLLPTPARERSFNDSPWRARGHHHRGTPMCHSSESDDKGNTVKQRSNTTYESQLLTVGRGFPLWVPQPSTRLPPEFQQRGVSIGDVGIITSTGQFDFLFNITLPADHPANPTQLPEGFTTLPLLPTDVQVFKEFPSDSHICGISDIQRKELSETDIQRGSKMIFDTSASEGAILALPEGAFQEDVHNMTSFREYMAQHIESWYRFANGPRGREAKNGDIRLVTGCDKSTSWGIASFSNHSLEPAQRKLKMTLLEDTGTKSSCNYKWEQFGPPAAVKAGPEKSEQRSALGDQLSSTNQCVFVRTLNALLSEDAWTQLTSPVALCTQNSSSSNLPSSESMSNGSPGSQSVDTLVSNQTPPHTNSAVSFTSLEGNMFDSSSWRDRQTWHPSQFINEHLLRFHSSRRTRVAISHDSIWRRVAADGLVDFGDPLLSEDTDLAANIHTSLRGNFPPQCEPAHTDDWSVVYSELPKERFDNKPDYKAEVSAEMDTLISDLESGYLSSVEFYLFGSASTEGGRSSALKKLTNTLELTLNSQQLRTPYLENHPRRPFLIDDLLFALRIRNPTQETIEYDDPLSSKFYRPSLDEELANNLLNRSVDFDDKNSVDEAIFYYRKAEAYVQYETHQHLEVVLGLCNAFYRRMHYRLDVGIQPEEEIKNLKHYLQIQSELDHSAILNTIRSTINSILEDSPMSLLHSALPFTTSETNYTLSSYGTLGRGSSDRATQLDLNPFEMFKVLLQTPKLTQSKTPCLRCTDLCVECDHDPLLDDSTWADILSLTDPDPDIVGFSAQEDVTDAPSSLPLTDLNFKPEDTALYSLFQTSDWPKEKGKSSLNMPSSSISSSAGLESSASIGVSKPLEASRLEHVPRACISCRRQKLKCILSDAKGTRCQRCIEHNFECVVSPVPYTGPAAGRPRLLETVVHDTSD